MSIVKKYAGLVALVLVFLLLVVFRHSDDPIFVAMVFIGGFALFVAAVSLLACAINRYERAAFLASLSEAEAVGLWAYEALHGWDSWRDFSEIIKLERAAKAKSQMHPSAERRRK